MSKETTRSRATQPDSAFLFAENDPAPTGVPAVSAEPSDADEPPPSLPELDKSAGTPREIWNDYFSKRKPEPKVVAQLILKLHQRKQHEHVIAAIEAALVGE